MIVKVDEDNFSIKLYRDFVKGKLVGLMEVIPIDELLEVWADRKTENSSEKPNNCEPKICDTCRYYNSNIPCGSTPSACKEADKFAEEFVDGLKKLKSKTEPTISKTEQVEEPQTDCLTCRYNSDEWDSPKCDGCSKAYSNYEPQTDCAWR